MLYMLWKECMPVNFYQHICKEKNFLYLNVKNVQQPKVTEIINEYLDKYTNNYNEMRKNLSQYKNIFQYVCTLMFFQRFIALQNSEDLISKVHFTSCLKHVRTKKR